MGTAHARKEVPLTNIEWLYSLEPDELKAWFETEYDGFTRRDMDGWKRQVSSLLDKVERLQKANESLACAVANYRDMLGE